jgi:cell division GTPase FtsZ
MVDKEKQMEDSLAAARGDKPTPPSNRAADVSPVSARVTQPAHDAQASEEPRSQVECTAGPGLRLAIVGSGQGGGRIANEFYNLGYKQVAVFNTTDQDFEGLSKKLPRLSLHIGGAAKNMELAHNALARRADEAWELVEGTCERDVDLGLICACLGGGTGSGTAPFLVDMMRGYVNSGRVGAVVSLPDPREGYQVSRNAVLSFRKLVDMKVSPLIVMDNTKIRSLYEVSIAKLFKTANEAVTQLLHLFITAAGQPSPHQSLDPAELLSVLDAGIVTAGSMSASTDELEQNADLDITAELKGNLLASTVLTDATHSALLTFGSEDAFEINPTSISARVLLPFTNVIHRGVYPGEEPGVQHHLVVGGPGGPEAALSALAKKGGLQGPDGRSKMADYLGV